MTTINDVVDRIKKEVELRHLRCSIAEAELTIIKHRQTTIYAMLAAGYDPSIVESIADKIFIEDEVPQPPPPPP